MLGLMGSSVLSLPHRTFVSLANVLTDFAMLLHLHISPRGRLVVFGVMIGGPVFILAWSQIRTQGTDHIQPRETNSEKRAKF